MSSWFQSLGSLPPACQTGSLRTYPLICTAAVAKIPTNWSKQLSTRRSPEEVVLAPFTPSVSRIFHISALYPTAITSISQVVLAIKKNAEISTFLPGPSSHGQGQERGRGWCAPSHCCDDKALWKRELETGLCASVHHTAGTCSCSPDQKYERRPHALKQELKKYIYSK